MNKISELIRSVDEKKSPIVVGLDTTLAMIPEDIVRNHYEEFGKVPRAVSEMLLFYNKIVINHIYDLVPAIKMQIAMYEKYGLWGITAYVKTIEYAKEKGLLIIGDIKRGDIGSTASAYASHLSGVDLSGNHFDEWKEDMITVNPYLGKDSLLPFAEACNKTGKACFVLVKTSNPGSTDIQDIISCDTKRPIYESVGDIVSDIGVNSIDSDTGYSLIGAVVGATHKDVGMRLRQNMSHSYFLVPGYGAQGAKAEDIAGFFDKNGRGAIVNSSRGIIANWQKDPRFESGNIGVASRDAVLQMKKALDKVL